MSPLDQPLEMGEARAAHLVGVRRGNEQDRALPWDLPGASGMDLTEEQIDKDGHEPQESVIFPVAHGVELGGRLWRAGALGWRRQTRARSRGGGRGGGIVGRHVRSCSDGDPGQRCWCAFWWKRRGRRSPGREAPDWFCGVVGVLIQSGSGLIEAETEACDGVGASSRQGMQRYERGRKCGILRWT